LKLIAGLGNPGRAYAATRHNIGFMVVDRLAADYGIGVERSKFNARFGRGTIEGRAVILAKPQAYMNRSGLPLSQLTRFFKIPCTDLIVIHDDMDIAFGRIKIKQKGGSGGHKGIRSLREAFGDDRFVRVRVGVGRPTAHQDAADYVLANFSPAERRMLDEVIAQAREAVVTILREGAQVAMNRFNGLNTLRSG